MSIYDQIACARSRINDLLEVYDQLEHLQRAYDKVEAIRDSCGGSEGHLRRLQRLHAHLLFQVKQDEMQVLSGDDYDCFNYARGREDYGDADEADEDYEDSSTDSD
jgi:hypothetical protein